MQVIVYLADDSQKQRKAVDYSNVFFLNDSKMAMITASAVAATTTTTPFQQTLSYYLEVSYFSYSLSGQSNTQGLIVMKIMMVCAITVLNVQLIMEEE